MLKNYPFQKVPKLFVLTFFFLSIFNNCHSGSSMLHVDYNPESIKERSLQLITGRHEKAKPIAYSYENEAAESGFWDGFDKEILHLSLINAIRESIIFKDVIGADQAAKGDRGGVILLNHLLAGNRTAIAEFYIFYTSADFQCKDRIVIVANASDISKLKDIIHFALIKRTIAMFDTCFHQNRKLLSIEEIENDRIQKGNDFNRLFYRLLNQFGLSFYMPPPTGGSVTLFKDITTGVSQLPKTFSYVRCIRYANTRYGMECVASILEETPPINWNQYIMEYSDIELDMHYLTDRIN